jgi:Na+/phosphate symporter
MRGPETGTNEFASSYLLSKARLNLAEQEMERMQNKASSSNLLEQLSDLLQRGDEG